MFKDCNAKQIIFYNNYKNKGEEVGTQTSTYETEYADSETQCFETNDNEAQTDIKEMFGSVMDNNKYDKESLDNFIKRAFVLVNDALNSRIDEIYEFYEEDEKDLDYVSEIVLRISINNSFKISDIAWNSNGTILAIANYIDNHQGPCSHQTNIIFLQFTGNISDKVYTKIELETNACIKAIEGHPTLPNIFIACSYIGEIYYINLNLTDQIEFSSKIDSNFHKECIISVRWVLYEKTYYIISLSDEGRLLVWNPSDKLSYPTLGFNLKTKIAKTEMAINPTFIGENPFDIFNFIIGTLDGNLYKCAFDRPEVKNEALFQQSSGVVWRNSIKLLMSNMPYDDLIKMKTFTEKFCRDKNIIDLNAEEFYKLKPDLNKLYKNSLKSNYEKHISYVTSISYNSFTKGLFLTTSYDGSLRIYNQSAPKYILANHLIASNYYTNAIWSPFKANIIIAGTSSGNLTFFKIIGKNLKKIHSIDRKIENSSLNYPINKIRYNHGIKSIIAVSYEDGIIDFIKLNESFYDSSFNEASLLSKLMN